MTGTLSTTSSNQWHTGTRKNDDSALRVRRRSWACGVALLLLLSSGGCSDGTVVANGQVLIEGKPANGGRLLLTRIGGGPQAFSLITENGDFALRTSGDSLGAFPGSYRVSLHQPLDAKTRQRLAGVLAGQLSTEELSVSYRSPRDQPFDVPETGDENIVIEVSAAKGWTRSVNE